MNLLVTQNIKTKRFMLRTFVITDVEKIFTNWTSLTETIHYLPWELSKSVEDIGLNRISAEYLVGNIAFIRGGI